MFRFQDIQVFAFLTNQICDVMMSVSTSDRVHSSIYLLNHNSLSRHIFIQLIDISKGSNFQESFEQLAGLGLSSSFFSRTFSILFQLLNNQLCQDSSVSFFLKR